MSPKKLKIHAIHRFQKKQRNICICVNEQLKLCTTIVCMSIPFPSLAYCTTTVAYLYWDGNSFLFSEIVSHCLKWWSHSLHSMADAMTNIAVIILRTVKTEGKTMSFCLSKSVQAHGSWWAHTFMMKPQNLGKSKTTIQFA